MEEVGLAQVGRGLLLEMGAADARGNAERGQKVSKCLDFPSFVVIFGLLWKLTF